MAAQLTYDANDRLSDRVGPTGVTTWAYDANGAVLSEIGPQIRTFEYNPENRLSRVLSGPDVLDYGYDAVGNRVARYINGVSTRFLVDIIGAAGLPQVVEERGGGGRDHGVGGRGGASREDDPHAPHVVAEVRHGAGP